MPALANMTVIEAADAIHQRKATSLELLEACWANLDAANPSINAIIWEEREQAAAAALDIIVSPFPIEYFRIGSSVNPVVSCSACCCHAQQLLLCPDRVVGKAHCLHAVVIKEHGQVKGNLVARDTIGQYNA